MATANSTRRTTGRELTSVIIANLRKPGQYADQSITPLGKLRRGLVLKVTKTKKSWIFRTKQDGKTIRLTLGEFPDLGLAEAREWFDHLKLADDPIAKLAELRGNDAKGGEPEQPTLTNRELLKLNMQQLANIGQTLTIRQMVLLFREKHDKQNNREATWRENERMFEYDLLPEYGDRLAYRLTADDVADMIDSVLARGSQRSAQKLLTATKTMYNWGMGKLRRKAGEVPKQKIGRVSRKVKILPIDANPCDGIEIASYKPRQCHLDEEGLQIFLKRLPTLPIRDDVKNLLMLQLQTVTRVTEVAGLPWEEINFRTKVWTLPAERSKNKQEHKIMLARQSVELLKRRRKTTEGEFVFPNRSAERHFNCSRVGEYIADNREALGVPPDFTSHSLRHTALTWFASREAEGATKGVRDRLSNHKPNTSTDMDSRYNKHKYDDEAREWTQRWCDFLEEVVR